MKIGKAVAQEIADKIKEFSATLESKYGVVVGRTACTYSDVEMKFTVNLAISKDERESGALTPAEAQYDQMRNACNLPPRGTALVDAYGEKWVPVEWIPKGRKYNILAVKQSDGKRYKFTDRSLAVMKRA